MNLRAMLTNEGLQDKLIGVRANVASLCPCSKEISDYGAHNQRSEITMDVRPYEDEFIWFEDLIDIGEYHASCQLYPILKRTDEKYVTERAYNNPKFVEDIVRDVATDLLAMMDEERISRGFTYRATTMKASTTTMHYAKIERGVRGPLLTHRKEAENALMV